jgi:DNA-binding MarR family transcriptional regulator
LIIKGVGVIDQNVAQIADMVVKIARQTVQWTANENISKEQFYLLATLKAKRRTTISDLAELLNLTPSATTIAINRLVGSGHVFRVRDEKDRRLVWVEVTEKAVDLITKLCAHRNKLLAGMLANLTDEEIRQFIALLSKMVAHLPHSSETSNDSAGKERSHTRQ